MENIVSRIVLLAVLLLPFTAWAQQQSVPLSIEYYQQRITEINARAASLTYENARLRAELEALRTMLTKREKSSEP